jgi:hypothetical protein
VTVTCNKNIDSTFDRFHHTSPRPRTAPLRGQNLSSVSTITTHREHFVSFMEFVRDVKEKTGHNHIEKNFYNAIKNTETLTELCVLAFYNVAVSRPFMQHIRKHNNMLELKSFFEKKVAFMESIISDTKI